MRALALLCLLTLTGCGAIRDTGRFVDSHGEAATWAAHSVAGASTIVAAELIADEPWWGYLVGMAGIVGWELSEWSERDKRGLQQARAWTTAMDIAVPAVTGALIAWILNRGGEPDA
jgi:hypothetical protein